MKAAFFDGKIALQSGVNMLWSIPYNSPNISQ